MRKFSDVATINQTLERARAQGMGLPETALRRWVHERTIPVAFVGSKALIYWPALMDFLNGRTHGGALSQTEHEDGRA
jgi:hypothetical protein